MKSTLTVRKLFGGALTRLREGQSLASFGKCVSDRLYGDRLRVFEGKMRMVFVKSRFISRRFCLSLGIYDRALNLAKEKSVEKFMQHEQRVSASL